MGLRRTGTPPLGNVATFIGRTATAFLIDYNPNH